MKFRRPLVILGAIALLLMGSSGGTAGAATQTGTAQNFNLVGHDSLFGRGENAALALYPTKDFTYVYVGSRSDGAHLHPGVEIVKVKTGRHPQVLGVVGEIPIPDPKLTTGDTSRELRVWPQQKMLMVVHFGCSAILHACVSGADLVGTAFPEIAFYDLTNPASPALVAIYKPSTTPHELFLWVDPQRPATRALLYWTSPNNSSKQLVVTDLSGWRSSSFPEIAVMRTPPIPTSIKQADGSTYDFDVRLHSLSLSADGTRGYLAYLGGGVLIIDTSRLANPLPAGTDPTQVISLVTPVSGRAFWDDQGAHSSVLIPGVSPRYILTTEEIYGKMGVASQAFGPALSGCHPEPQSKTQLEPGGWGWVRIVDMSNPTQLRVVSSFQIDENRTCAEQTPQDNFSSYASHNPTVLPDQAFITWHSGGLRAINLNNPLLPAQDGVFVPTPDSSTGNPPNHTPDPSLEPGSNGTIAWSYPIISQGLIYYIDIANGLYVVRYTGPHSGEVGGVTFFEGNSNLGDALVFAGLKPAD